MKKGRKKLRMNAPTRLLMLAQESIVRNPKMDIITRLRMIKVITLTIVVPIELR
jgi:hypothetical protein